MSISNTGRASALWAPLLLAAVILGAYAGTLRAEFVYDDIGSIVENPAIRWSELSFANVGRAWFGSPTRRGVANASFGLNYRLGGLDPFGYHVFNLIVHLVNALLVYGLTRRVLREALGARVSERALEIGALSAALLFAAHPIQTQSVAYIVQRMNALAALFTLAGLELALRARAAATRGSRIGLWLAALFSWFLGVGSKEIAIVLPALIWLHEWLLRPGFGGRRSARAALGVALGCALMAAAVVALEGEDPLRAYAVHPFGMGERLLSQPRAIFFYLGLLIWPAPSRMNLMHDFPASHGLLDPPTTLLALVGLAVSLVLALVAARRWPWLAFGWLWFLGCLALESSVLPLRLAHEHRLYLPWVGLCIAAGGGLAQLAGRQPRVAIVAISVCVFALAATTRARNAVWQGPFALWSDVAAKSPANAEAQVNLGAALAQAGRGADAMQHYLRARELDPDLADPHRSIATQLHADGRLEEALPHYARAIQLDERDHRALGGLGTALRSLDRAEESLPYLLASLARYPNELVALQYARALQALDRSDEALAAYAFASELDPRDPIAPLERAMLSWSLGAETDALASAERAMLLSPNWRSAWNAWSWMVSTSVDVDESSLSRADLLTQRLLEGEGADEASYWDTRAAVQAALGSYADASASAERALSLAQSSSQREEISVHLAAYRSGRRWVAHGSVSP